jgi:Ni/Co efflux regulator RcnB
LEEVNFVKRFEKFAALSVVSAMLCSGMAFAQDQHNDSHNYPQNNQSNDNHAQDQHDQHHDNNAYVHHAQWKKGYHMDHADWNRGEQVDWHAHHLRTPPHGYEWRETDGNYVLAAVATGLIASVIVASSVH